jgi:hypothetical protein
MMPDLTEEVFIKYAQFEIRRGDSEKANRVFQLGLEKLSPHDSRKLYSAYISHTKQTGSRDQIDQVLLAKRVAYYENQLLMEPQNLDYYFDYIRMEEEAERTGLLKKLRGNAGLFPFSRAHRHLFGLRVLQDKLISVSERLRLIHHIMLASHESNGAALDIAALFEWKLVSLLPVRSVTQAQALIDSCCSFWPFKWDSLPLDAIKDFFGADVATFFFFQQHLTRCSYLLAVLSCIVFAFRYELNRAPFAEALWCCIVLAACSVTITTWQTRLEETLYFWGMSIKFPGIGCVARKKEIGEGTVLSITNPDILMAFNRKYFSICLVLLIAVASSTCISVVVALAIRNQCTNVRSQELFDDRRVVSFAVAETVRAIAFKFLAHYPFRALSAWQQSSSVDMPALPSYDTTIVCDILFFVFHLLNLLAIPFYLVFFVAVDPAITTLAQRTYCLRVRALI